MPQRRPHRLRSWLPRIEQLEDRSVPAVTAAIDGAGLLTVTLGAGGDSAIITGTAAGGTAIDVTDVGATSTQSFTGVTAINVVDGGSNLTQSVKFEDAGAGTALAVAGAITITGIESVDVATANGDLRAGSVSVDGASEIRFHADVTTDGVNGQTYKGPVVLDAPVVTLDAGATGGITFTQTVNGATAGASALVLNAGGATSFTAIIGGSKALASLTTDAAGTVKVGANVITTGNQTFNDPATVTGISVTLESVSSGDIRFSNTLDASTSGANSLIVNTGGVTTFAGTVGATPLGGLSTNAAGSTNIRANISTIGAQTYNDPIVLTGSAVTLASTVGANLNFNSTVNSEVAGVTALTVSTGGGTTTFAGSIGATAALASLTTDAGAGSTVFGTNSSTVMSVNTQTAQTYNDPIRLNASAVTFSSTLNGNITFNTTLNGTASVTTSATVNTGGVTSFNGVVGGTVPLDSLTMDLANQTGEQTAVRASITTTHDLFFGDEVVFNPGTGVLTQNVTSTVGDVSFGRKFSSASAVPVTIKAGSDVTFAGGGEFTASGSRLNVNAATGGTGGIQFAPGLTFRADTQVWQAGDGTTGGTTTATTDLVTNSPSFRDSTNTKSPTIFVLRQESAITDATIPAASQFGPSLPPNYTIISDDSTLTLNSTTALAGPATANLTLASAQALSLGATINAPTGIVRLKSTSANVSQTGGGIAAAAIGVRSGTSTALTAANSITGTFAAVATTTNIEFTNGAAYSVGAIGADPLGLTFSSVSGVSTGAGNITFSQSGSSPLNLTIAGAVSGSTITVTGGSANDTLNVNYTLGGTVVGNLTFNGNGGSDTANFTDAGGTAAHTYTVGSTFQRDSNAPINYSGVETVTVIGGTAADTFNVVPDASAAISVTGGLPTGSTGDKLTLTLAGTTNPNLSASKQSDGFQGSATFSNRAGITFNQMESIAPQADIQVTTSASPVIVPVNGSTTITVTVKNNGPDAATGIAFQNLIPSGFTATWTAAASAGSSVAATSGTGDIHTTMDLILNGTVTFTITATANSGFRGSATMSPSATAGSAAFDSNSANNTASVVLTVQPTALTAVAASAGAPHVKAYNADGSLRFSFFAYDVSYSGGVTVATGDVNGDGVEDIVTGSARGASHVKVFDGVTGSTIASFFAFPGFTGGVNVAVAKGDVIVGAGVGGGPIFAGYRITPAAVSQTFSLFAFDPGFRGGVQVAGSENFIAVGAGPTGAAHIKVYNAGTLSLVSSFLAFPATMTSGVNIAMGRSGTVETVIVGAGTGSTPAVVTTEAQTGNIVGSVLAFDPAFTGGVRTASTTTPAGQPGAVFAPGPGGASRVRIIGPTGAAVLDFFAFDPSYTGGVYVG